MNPYTRETIDHWVSDFCGSTRAGEVPAPAREWAADILTAFLVRACESRDVAPADVEERDVRAGLLEGAAPLGLPASVHEVTPALCALFLSEMQDQGRLSGGRALGLFARALLDPYLEASGTRSKPFVAPASRIGRNDPCPCGSGKKYKKCCQGLLGNQPG